MAQGLCNRALPPQHAQRDEASPCAPSGVRAPFRRSPMQWQKPTATDWRFGFEITMYVSAR